MVGTAATSNKKIHMKCVSAKSLTLFCLKHISLCEAAVMSTEA